MFSVVQRVVVNASAARFFQVISDHEGLSAWVLPSAQVSLIRHGSTDRNGVGAIGEITTGRFAGKAAIQRLSASRVEVVWAVDFTPSIWGLGRPLRWIIDRTIRQGLARLPQHVAAGT